MCRSQTRDDDPEQGKKRMTAVISSIKTCVPKNLAEISTLGRTLSRRAGDILAYFVRPATPTARPRPSTVASNTSAAPPSDSPISRTTPPGRSSRPAASDLNYTPNCEEPAERPGVALGDRSPPGRVVLACGRSGRRPSASDAPPDRVSDPWLNAPATVVPQQEIYSGVCAESDKSVRTANPSFPSTRILNSTALRGVSTNLRSRR